jgi:lysophospholipase L1-like esterase
VPVRLLLPVALAQGLWVRATVPRLPPARGHRGTIGGGAAPLAVVGIGDSIIAGVGVERQEQALLGRFVRRLHRRVQRPVHWRAHGANGAGAAEVLARIAPRVPAADLYLLSVGVNDAVRGTPARRYADALAALAGRLHERSPGAAILFAGIPPLERFPALPWPLDVVLGERAARLQSAARAVAARFEFTCFDFPPELPAGGFARDGFHPGSQACDTWAAWLLEAWLSRWAPVPTPAVAPPSPPA